MEELTIGELLKKYPHAAEFFDVNGLPITDEKYTIKEYIKSLPYVFLEDMGVDKKELLQRFLSFMKRMDDMKKENSFSIKSMTVIGGNDKSGKSEQIELCVNVGDVICIVGPTGSGKSRFLADIEWMAQKDSPTGRQILLDGVVPPEEWRFSIEHKLVAQLTQNMNFVMDVSVGEFISLHAQSRMVENVEEKIQQVINYANELSGEQFSLDTPLTSLSGGQSRALMVADTAFLSSSPIVLIDEIENAGIHRKKALELLVDQNKIVLIATHDPLLALMGQKRIVIKNGGIHRIIETTEEEKECLKQLEKMDKIMMSYREKLRQGELLNV